MPLPEDLTRITDIANIADITHHADSSDIARISQHLVRTGAFPATGRSLAQSPLHRVRHGWHIDQQFWAGLKVEHQYLARMIAVNGAARSPHSAPVFSHLSAATLHGFACHADFAQAVHVTSGAHRRGRATAGTIHHAAALRGDEIVEVHGLRCTSIDRTIVDLCKTGPSETALSFTDSFLRSEFRVRRRIDEARLGAWRELMAQRVRDSKGARGIRAVSRIVALADPRKDSVLESLSHLQLNRLGFDVELQVAVHVPGGKVHFADFEFVGLGVFGECDGKSKYADPAVRGGLSADEVVYREKRRDDVLQGVTGNRVVHWGYAEAVSAHTLGRRLQAFGVPVSRPL